MQYLIKDISSKNYKYIIYEENPLRFKVYNKLSRITGKIYGDMLISNFKTIDHCLMHSSYVLLATAKKININDYPELLI